MGSGINLPDWALQLSYFGLVVWLLPTILITLTIGQLPRLIYRDPLARLHIAFIIVQIFGLVNSISRFGAEGFLAGSYMLSVSVSFLIIYTLGIRLGEISTTSSLRRVSDRSIEIITLAMIPTISIGLIQIITHTGRDIDGVMRAYGGTSSPNVMGAMLLVYMAIIFCNGNVRHTPRSLIILFISFSVFVSCFSMSGFVAIIFSSIVYMVIKSWVTGVIKFRFSWLIMGLLAIYLTFAVVGTLLSSRFNELGQDDNSLMWRFRTWETYIDLLSQPKFLLFGGGLGFDHLGMEQEPHNEWIRVIMEVGLLGLAFYVAIWWRLARTLFEIANTPNALLQRRAAGMLAATAGLLLWAAVDSVVRTAPSALLLWASCGILIGLARSYSITASGPSGLEKET